MPSSILFNSIVTNGMETNALIQIGENNATGWQSHNKNQQSIGMTFGAFIVYPGNLNIMSDNDVLDTTINDMDYTPSVSSNV